MSVRVVLASRRFQRDYPQFLRKYPDMKGTLRDFLQFRTSARPDQPFNAKDGRLSDLKKFSRCHLVHGKAILVYQLHGSEIRLISVEEHNGVERNSKILQNFAKALSPDDFYQFNADTVESPLATKGTFMTTPNGTAPNGATDSVPNGTTTETPSAAGMPLPVELSSSQEQPQATVEPEATVNPLMDAKLIQYLQGQQLLYEPRPAHPMIVLRLVKDFIAPSGDALVIDTVNHTIHHLTANELHAHFRPAARVATSLGQALATSMASVPEPVTEPVTEVTEPITEAIEEVDEEEDTVSELADVPAIDREVAPQVGRLLLIMAAVGQKLGSSSLATYMPERDRKAISAVLANAQKTGLVKKAGVMSSSKGRRGYLYCLTANGERIGKSLDDWPFTVAGMPVPALLRRQMKAAG